MFSKPLLGSLFFLLTAGLLSCGSPPATAQTQPSTDTTDLQVNAPTALTGTMYSQPIDPGGRLLLSSWRDPDGSDFDQYVWDDFTLQSDQTITDIKWFGVYDPLKSGAGGPVLDFSVEYLSFHRCWHRTECGRPASGGISDRWKCRRNLHWIGRCTYSACLYFQPADTIYSLCRRQILGADRGYPAWLHP